MTSKKPLPEYLAKRIKPCPVDFGRIENFIKRAKKDLRSAGLISESDLEGAYQFLYTSMLHAALAYMTSHGAQPDIRGKHKTVIDYIAHALGKEYESKIRFFDRMRRLRHQLLYEPEPFRCTEKEIKDANKIATEFLTLISSKVREGHPQKDLDFDQKA